MSSFPVFRFLDLQQKTCAAFLNRQSGVAEMYGVERYMSMERGSPDWAWTFSRHFPI